MDNNLKATIREYAVSISDRDLEVLASRLTHNMSDDLAMALSYLSRSRVIDGILTKAKSAEELFNFCDEIRDVLQMECKKKGLVLTKGPVAA
jgi:hypothetical protein